MEKRSIVVSNFEEDRSRYEQIGELVTVLSRVQGVPNFDMKILHDHGPVEQAKYLLLEESVFVAKHEGINAAFAPQ